MRNLINEIQAWGRDKGITNLEKQQNKVLEEIGEFAKEINKNNREAMKIELGDIAVASIILADIKGLYLSKTHAWDYYLSLWDFKITSIDEDLIPELYCLANNYNLDLEECVQLAHIKNTNRKGETIDGQFVKSEDLGKHKAD